jgi:hypothetical protein
MTAMEQWHGGGDFGAYGGATALTLDTATNVLVTGQDSHEYPNFAYGTVKFGSNGSVIWVDYYPQAVLHYYPWLPSQTIEVSSANGIATDAANNVYVTSYSPGSNSFNNIVTIKYGPNGNQIWLQSYSGSASGNAAGNAIAVDNNGNIYVAGYDTTTAGGTEIVLIKYCPVILQPQANGTVLLEAQGSPGEIFTIQASADLQSWLTLGSATTDINGSMQFADTNAPNYAARFYVTSPQ